MRILIVEDDAYMGRVFERIFRLAGHTLIITTDGEEALEMLKTMDSLPDAILLDIVLPKMHGEDVLKHIKADARLAAIPVAVLTNSIHREHKDRVIAMGAQLYMVKIDHTPKQVLEEVEKLIGKK